MSELTKFLLARIGEEEREAEECSASPWTMGHDFEKVENRDGWVADGWASDVRLFVRWQPARVLAECAAKRRIVERYLHLVDHGDTTGYDDTLRALASVHADHPEYRAEWKP